MSVLQLTISYTNYAVRDFIPFELRRATIRVGAFLLIIFVALYLYLVSSAFSLDAKKGDIVLQIENEKVLMQRAETAMISADRLFQGYIADKGYAQGQTFDVIRRSRNVAKSIHTTFY